MNQPIRGALLVASIALAASLLQGCIGLLAAGGAVGTMSAIDRRSVGAQIEDQTLQIRGTQRLKEVMPGGDTSYANVYAYNRRLLITGLAPDEATKAAAGKLAGTLENVRSIDNEIQVGSPANVGSAGGDTAITARVKAQILNAKVDVNAVKVITESRVVYLMGVVTRSEGATAAEVASKVPNVQRVVTVFDYITDQELAEMQRRPVTEPPPTGGPAQAR